jgi:PAS domain S-box-containing protein
MSRVEDTDGKGIGDDDYRRLVETARETILVVDRDGRIRFANPHVRELTGYEPEEILGEPFLRLVPAALRDEAKERFARRLHGEDTIERVEGLIQRRDGEVRNIEITAGNRVEGGAVTGVQFFIRDITAQKEAESDLVMWKNRYEAAIRACGHVLFAWDHEADRVTYGGNIQGMLGYSNEELGTKLEDWVRLIHPDDRGSFREGVRRQTDEWRPSAMEYRVRRKDGEYITVDDRVYFFPDSQGKDRMIGTVADITPHRRAQERLRESQGRLRNLATHIQDGQEKERERIAREIHDELGTALTALKFDLSDLTRRLPPGEEDLSEGTRAMARRIETIIERVREISTMLRPGVLDDLGLAAALEWGCQEFQKRTGIPCSLESPEELALDRERATALFRIFQETLTNVVRHACAGRVEVALKAPEGELVLEVADDGRGIPDEKVRASDSLGLIGMRERALIWGGKVTIERAPGGGTRVRAVLPREPHQEGRT